MKGNNTLVLNEATMKEAVQEYLNKRMGEYAPQVVTIVQNATGINIRAFQIEVKD